MQFNKIILGEAATVAELLNLLREQQWDLLLLDVQLLDNHNTELINTIQKISPHLPILIISFQSHSPYVAEMIKAGVKGYLSRNDLTEKLTDAIHKAMNGVTYISPAIVGALFTSVIEDEKRKLSQLLSERELAVMSMLGQGKPPKRIAYDLNISIKTISTYRSRALRKLHMQSIAEFFLYAGKHNLVP